MKVKRRSPFTGQWNERDIPVTPEQIAAWQRGVLIQNAMPDITPDDREFIKTGITPDEWERMFA